MNQAEIENFYSEEAQEIIGGEPSWMIRRGMLILALILLALLFLCAFMQYPETIQGPVTLNLDSSGGYESKATIDLLSAHKVKVGQKVTIQLSEFQFSAYGLLEGRVSGIMEGPMDSVYIVDVKLQNGLKTSFKKKIKPKKILYGRISIIVETTTIFRKLFARLYSI
jgi:hypothetical protein